MPLQDVTTIEQYLNNMANELRDAAPYSSGDLADSIEYELDNTKSALDMGFVMDKWGIFQDKGVSGTQRKFNTPFSYGAKMPPPRSLDKWVVQNSIAPRDKKGKFIKRKSITYLIARSIQRKGITPKNWIEPVLDKNLDGLAFVLAEAIWQDFENKENNK